MPNTNEKTDFSKCLTKYEDILLSYFTVHSKRPLDLDENRINEAFKRITSEFPKMTEIDWPEKGGRAKERHYSISEKSPLGPTERTRVFGISVRGISLIASHPLSAKEQELTILSLAKVVEFLKIVSPLLSDSVDFRVMFEFRCVGNHHRKVLDVLFKGSFFERMVNQVSGITTLFNPEIFILHPKDKSLRFIADIRPQTSIQEIESDKYDGDEIQAVCTAAKFSDFSSEVSIVDLCEQLKNECLSFVKQCYLKNIVDPLSSSLRSVKDD